MEVFACLKLDSNGAFYWTVVRRAVEAHQVSQMIEILSSQLLNRVTVYLPFE